MSDKSHGGLKCLPCGVLLHLSNSILVMGYTTEFQGSFQLNKPLLPAHKKYLEMFADTRRMQRDPKFLEADGSHSIVGLPLGSQGEYYVDGAGFRGQDRDSSVTDYNSSPAGQPSLWCQWVPSEDGTEIEWDEGEKFRSYVAWLNYLIEHFLTPWGYELNGEVRYRGEDFSDNGTILCVNSQVKLV